LRPVEFRDGFVQQLAENFARLIPWICTVCVQYRFHRSQNSLHIGTIVAVELKLQKTIVQPLERRTRIPRGRNKAGSSATFVLHNRLTDSRFTPAPSRISAQLRTIGWLHQVCNRVALSARLTA